MELGRLMANVNDIASYIYSRAPQFGVNPNLALGVARFEGLNPNTIGSSTFGNRDARGYSFGPFQLFSGSPDPSKIAPGGMAYEFQQKYGAAPSRENWQQQVDFSLERMGKSGTGPWYAVRNRGGPEAVTRGGEEYAATLGLLGPGKVPSEVAFAQPDKTTVEPSATPVYSQDIGTSFRRAGNFFFPDAVEAPTPLTPEQIETQKQEMSKQASEFKNINDSNSALKGFLSMLQMGQQQQQQEAPMAAPQVMGGQFRPLARMRGYL
jgi:energy-coupling factor transporter ATP-binding protein EcfA2